MVYVCNLSMLKTAVNCTSKDSDNNSTTIVIDSESSQELEIVMQTDEPDTSNSRKKHNSNTEISPKTDKPESVKKHDKKQESEEPKPRIVLTFRSEKIGVKSTNMKIVSTEEKHEEISPRRSSRHRNAKWDSDDDNETLVSPNKEKNVSPISETDEASDSSLTTKRSTRRRRREFSDNVLANAIARKESIYDNISNPGRTQRQSLRHIQPTSKVFTNKEPQIGLESQNSALLAISAEKSTERGVKTRRSTRKRSVECEVPETVKKSTKRLHDAEDEELQSIIDSGDSQNSNNVKKLRHLCELGLKAVDDTEADEDISVENLDIDKGYIEESDDIKQAIEDDDEYDDESEVISKLIEADATSEDSDDEFYCSTEVAKGKPRRSSRLLRRPYTNDSDDHKESTSPIDDELKSSRHRSSRARRANNISPENEDMPAGGDEGEEATCPSEEAGRVDATCCCNMPSNVYAAPEELTEPVFCQAIETVDEVRVGCSHGALRHEDRSLAALVRAGPRAPYFLACKLHAAQLRMHLCCPTCGLFCSQGVFYQCSEGHLFHLECGVFSYKYEQECSKYVKLGPGCPHCGVYCYGLHSVNRSIHKVRVEMKCSNKRIYLPDQREQCTPAYISFSSLKPPTLEHGPVIPEDLLPSPPVNLKELCKKQVKDCEESISGSPVEILYDAIVAGETLEQLIPKIVCCPDINARVVRGHRGAPAGSGGAGGAGDMLLHAAARCGRLAAVYALHYAGANIDAVVDENTWTPLMVAMLALLDKSEDTTNSKLQNKRLGADGKEIDKDKDPNETEAKESELGTDEIVKCTDEDLMKVIRYLIAAGCDVNCSAGEGLTPLHVAAQYGATELCSLLAAAGADVDARDLDGWSPLVWAAENKYPDVVRLLLSLGACGEARDAEGNAALHWCALGGDHSALALLLQAEPRVLNYTNQHGDTPLHIAARQGHYACVVTLLARGARTDIENAAGELAVEVCSGSCQTAISLNMQIAVASQGYKKRSTLLSSDISRGRETYPIPCVNEVDDTPLPDDFTYVTANVMPQQIYIDSTIGTMQGCTCPSRCGEDTCACALLGVRRWWARGRLAHGFPYHEPPMLFECNQTCACDLNKCENYVVTRASKKGSMLVRGEVFRTARCGWGLRATGAVLRGVPVATYCGELLDAAQADARPADEYMFALDVKPDLLEVNTEGGSLCVDAARFGGAARFMNHSCVPSLAPVRVFTHTRDLRLPNITLFAVRDIKPGEEFTFDYGDKFWSVKSKWMKCECGSSDCRYPTKSTEDIESS